MDELTKEFLIESQEGLDRMERCLTELESRPGDAELIAEIFRAVHTIKGTTGFLGFHRLESLSHAGENLLSLVREGRVAADSVVITELLRLMDGLRNILQLIEATGDEGNRAEDDDSELIGRLRALQGGLGDESGNAAGDVICDDGMPAGGMPAGNWPAGDWQVGNAQAWNAQAGGIARLPMSVPARTGQPAGDWPGGGQPAGSQPGGGQPGARIAPARTEISVLVEAALAESIGTSVGSPGTALSNSPLFPTPVRLPAASQSTLRVDVELLNRMMNLVGELVLTRNQIVQRSLSPGALARSNGLQAGGAEQNPTAPDFAPLARRLDMVTAELREAVMKARMQSVGQVFQKFPRMVRDLARTCGRQVRLELEGQETELDKSLLEAIKDPVAHAVRNAVDHGIESPEARRRAGKSAEGMLWLRAFQEGSYVVIEVQDDGAGIAAEKVLAKALERRLITEEKAAGLSGRDVLQLIFLPGFSTAAQVTSISGRGVGMDVVRTNVEKIGGKVEVDSQPGIGTRVRMRIPLTLAIVPALVVRSCGQSFALPQSALFELVYVAGREVKDAVEWVDRVPVHRLRGRLLPLVWLSELLDLTEVVPRGDGRRSGASPSPATADHWAHAGEASRAAEAAAEAGLAPEARLVPEAGAAPAKGFYLAVLDADGRRFGLVVDELQDPEEIVVKPLSPVLRQVGLFSGATVLGNGTLALILDPGEVAARAGVRPQKGADLLSAGARDARMQGSHAMQSTNGRGNGSTGYGLAGYGQGSYGQNEYAQNEYAQNGYGQTGYGETERRGEQTMPASDKGMEFLVFATGRHRGTPTRLALPLERVERIETVPYGQIEYARGGALLQFRGGVLPLRDISGLLPELERDGTPETAVNILVCRQNAGPGDTDRDGQIRDGSRQSRPALVGLVVREELDVLRGESLPGSGALVLLGNRVVDAFDFEACEALDAMREGDWDMSASARADRDAADRDAADLDTGDLDTADLDTADLDAADRDAADRDAADRDTADWDTAGAWQRKAQ